MGVVFEWGRTGPNDIALTFDESYIGFAMAEGGLRAGLVMGMWLGGDVLLTIVSRTRAASPRSGHVFSNVKVRR